MTFSPLFFQNVKMVWKRESCDEYKEEEGEKNVVNSLTGDIRLVCSNHISPLHTHCSSMVSLLEEERESPLFFFFYF